MRHVAIPARPGARVAENHEGCGAMVPALADVGAVGFLADRVEAERAHQPLEPVVVLRPRRADLQPLGLRLPRQLVVALLATANEVEGGYGHLLVWCSIEAYGLDRLLACISQLAWGPTPKRCQRSLRSRRRLEATACLGHVQSLSLACVSQLAWGPTPKRCQRSLRSRRWVGHSLLGNALSLHPAPLIILPS